MSIRRVVRLPEAVANQIAAGEVVERPASVVKELAENAIDAGATRVEVAIEGGGIELIRIIDDGCGMPREDAVLALERHATSKIRAAEDLISVATLGFRGEALPSIASVSRFTLLTRPRDQAEGTRLFVEGGALKEVAAAGTAVGTTIEVRDLFFNVPARRKFLKTPQTEVGHVSEAITRLALARPEVAFVLSSGGRTVLEVAKSAEGDPRGRLGRILGRPIAERLFPVIPPEGDHAIGVTGFISAPDLNERTPRSLHVFVNGRYVRDRTIQHAIQDAYRTLLERGRHPVVLLHIELDPSGVDVNVHPQKIEVRFADSGRIHRAVTGALQRTLAAEPWLEARERAAEPAAKRYTLRTASAATPSARSPATPPGTGFALQAQTSPLRGRLPFREEPWIGVRDGAGAAPEGLFTRDARGPEQVGGTALARRFESPPVRGPSAVELEPDAVRAAGVVELELPEVREPSAFEVPASSRAVELEALEETGEPRVRPRPPPSQLETPGLGGHFGALEPVGQVMGTYLLCQGPGRMVLIDQHAAHERIAFEKMRGEARSRAVVEQPLLIPQSIELDPARAAIALDASARLREVGIELEHFGGNTFIVKSRPRALGSAGIEQLVLDLLDELKDVGETTPMQETLEKLLSCAACHTVVGAGARRGAREINALLREMDAIDFGAHCPHGRPVFVEWSERDLAKLFHRT